jgi:hypothetical protein
MTRLTLPARVHDLMRREELCAAHPQLRVSAGTGHWQAEITEPSGKTIITRYELGELLDRVEVALTAT